MEMSTLQILTLAILLKGTCGEDVGSYITGGEDCQMGEFPFMARLLFENKFRCGCTIINPSWVLTAGHCGFDRSAKDFQIDYGSIQGDATEMKSVKVSKIVIHPNYEQFERHYALNDIALYKVEPEIIFSEHVQAVKLPEMDEPTPDNMPGIALGWGRQRPHGSDLNILQKVVLPVVPDEVCKKLYNERFFPSNICAGSGDSDKDICNGDSGGPLLVNDVQVGITSWFQDGCGKGPYPSVFTKVSNYISWITDTLKDN